MKVVAIFAIRTLLMLPVVTVVKGIMKMIQKYVKLVLLAVLFVI